MGMVVKKKRKKHINDFRTDKHRVFYAAPYFNMDLWQEISWHKKHLRTLKKHSKKPHLFHNQFTNEDITKDRERHFKEHVVDSIPFHQKILDENQKRLKAILKLVPRRTYKKIVNISKKHGGTPEYFVYNKANKDFFFVAEKLDDSKKNWMELVKDTHQLCDVVVLK
jgi:hypothetical protein